MCPTPSLGNPDNKNKPKQHDAAWYQWAARTFRTWEIEEEEAWFRYLSDFPNLAIACSRLCLGLGQIVPQRADGSFVVGVSVLEGLAHCSRSPMYKELKRFDETHFDPDNPRASLSVWKWGSRKTGAQAQWRVQKMVSLDPEVEALYKPPVRFEQVKQGGPVQNDQVTCSKRDVKGPCKEVLSELPINNPPTHLPGGRGGLVGGLDVEASEPEEQKPLPGKRAELRDALVRLGPFKPERAEEAARSCEEDLVESSLLALSHLWEKLRSDKGLDHITDRAGLLCNRIGRGTMRDEIERFAASSRKSLEATKIAEAPSRAAKAPRIDGAISRPLNPSPECDKESEDLWERVRLALSKQLPEASFREWIAPCEPMKLEDGALWIQVPSAAAKLWIEQQLPEEFNDALENAGLRDLRLEFWVAGTSLETTVANDIDSGTANAPQRDLATTQPPMATPEFSNRMVLHQTLWDAMGDDWLDEAVDILDSIDILGGGQQVTLRLNVPLDDQQTESLRRATKKIGWVIRIEENESPAQAC